jgi:hypothetical protein
MILGAGSFQIRGMGLSRVMPGALCGGVHLGFRGAPTARARRRRYVTATLRVSGAGLRGFVLCCGKL